MKIGIVGTGFVGTSAAYAMILKGIGSEIVLVDKDADRAAAEAQDLRHAVPFAHAANIHSGDYAVLAGSSVVVIAAGVNQRPGESRLDLLDRNASVFGEVVPSILKHAPEAILVIATNPVDIMTQVAYRLSGLDRSRVIGSGTILDTARFRDLLGQHLGTSPQSVHAYVLGEHGNSEVLHWSAVKVGSLDLATVAKEWGCPIDEAVKARIDDGVRGAAGRIIAGKGATNYGIGAGLARMVDAIISNENAIITASIFNDEVEGVKDICLSLPRLVGGKGITATLQPPLDPAEHEALKKSAETLKEYADQVEKNLPKT